MNHELWNEDDKEAAIELMEELKKRADYLTFDSYEILSGGLGEYFILRNVTFHRDVYLERGEYTYLYDPRDKIYSAGDCVDEIVAQNMKLEIKGISGCYFGLINKTACLTFFADYSEDRLW